MRSDQQITEIIRLASIASVALPLLMYLTKFRYASKPVHLIGALTIVSAASDLAAYFLFARGESTVVLFNVYYVILFLVLAWFYYEVFLSKSGRTTIVAGFLAYILSFILVSMFVQPFSTYQTFMWTITGMIMIFFSITYFIHLFSARAPMGNYEYLWFNSGVLLYFSLNLFLFIMSSYVLTKLDPEISLLIWSFHNVNNIMKNALFGCGIYALSKSGSLANQNDNLAPSRV
jgi:hypothetical protein